MNHQFRDTTKNKWRNGEFQVSMKLPDMEQANMLMNDIQTADPYQDGMDFIGHNLMLRKREEKKEVAKEPFKSQFRTSSATDTAIVQA